MTVSVARPILPTLLIDQQLTVVWPMGNVEPERGRQCAGRAPSMASFADAVKVAGAPVSDVAATVTSPDVVTTGGFAVSAPGGMRSLQSPAGHSFTSKQPTYPSPAKSFGQELQVREPFVFRHAESLWQPPLLTAHSFTSTHPVAGDPVNPGGQLSPHCQAPGFGPSLQATPAAHPPLSTAHGLPCGVVCSAEGPHAPSAISTAKTMAARPIQLHPQHCMDSILA